jgi:RNA polymerase sigma-70 factor, ECF subfamily
VRIVLSAATWNGMSDSSEIDQTLDAVMRGRADEFLIIVRTYSPAVRAFLATQLFHTDDVDDLAQETFIAAYRSLHNFRRGEDFGAWLRGIAHHRLLRYFDQTSRRTAVMESFRMEGARLIESELEEAAGRTRSENLQAMLNCVAKLPDRMRAVVRSWLDGAKSAALAEEMATTTGAIYQLQYRALALLRACISRETSHGS